MPVYLEPVTTPSEQDLIDLTKLYADYPTPLNFAELQAALTDDNSLTLYGARFNGRLLGAISLKAEDNTALLNHLCVRKVTRQRTVGRELLRLILDKTDFRQYRLESCIDDAALDALFSKMGFSKTGNCYSLQR